MRPFEDVRVLDFTHVVAGPACTQALGALGAEIIKVEPPTGDPGREIIQGAFFSAFNLGGKRSISVDLKTDEGQRIVQELASDVDVIVENFRPGVLAFADLDYESLSQDNEDIIYCSISGYGQDGPYAKRPSLDPIAQASSGLMAMTGHPDQKPVRVGSSPLDISTGIMGAFLISAALRQRDNGGDGEHIDVSLYDMAIQMLAYWIADYTGTNEVPTRSGDGFGKYTPYGIFYARDEEPFYVVAPDDVRFQKVCSAVGCEELLDDERYNSEEDRKRNGDALTKALNDVFSDYDVEEVVERLVDNDVPAGSVKRLDDVIDHDPHLQSRDILVDSYNHFLDKPVQTSVIPFHTQDGYSIDRSKPPRLGAHTEAILAELGYSTEDIQALYDDDVVYTDT